MKHQSLFALLLLAAVGVASCDRDGALPSPDGGVHADGPEDTVSQDAGRDRDGALPSPDGGVHADGPEDIVSQDAGRDVPEESCSASDMPGNGVVCYETTPPCYIPMGRPQCMQECYYGGCYSCIGGRWVRSVIDCISPDARDSAPVDTESDEASAG
jgi:hypothetical protein